ncbi:hypothetical protein DFJ58DRAFT_885936 [Suillus subalutaceus]|uniref:uncharacterized protein n=1 Tax=Suillus subalutaceus TaxID=48586 RepID=UPI001B87F39F|nr:uncharacterized protein DFJ58DRAFT_885936 [Suillus subalutaceus]KAG1851851.1 hypothetical protein DFJ58DRAFT_885936 [Suillus subalutaceus]
MATSTGTNSQICGLRLAQHHTYFRDVIQENRLRCGIHAQIIINESRVSRTHSDNRLFPIRDLGDQMADTLLWDYACADLNVAWQMNVDDRTDTSCSLVRTWAERGFLMSHPVQGRRSAVQGGATMKGRVMKATKKQTAAPNKLAPKPSSLGIGVCAEKSGGRFACVVASEVVFLLILCERKVWVFSYRDGLAAGVFCLYHYITGIVHPSIADMQANYIHLMLCISLEGATNDVSDSWSAKSSCRERVMHNNVGCAYSASCFLKFESIKR